MENNLSLVKDSFKELPNNIEAEQAVIGSILVSNEIFDEINTIMTNSTEKNRNNNEVVHSNNGSCNSSNFTGKDSPWMQYIRQKVVHGGVEDNRSVFAQKYLASRSNFVKRKLENVLKKTVEVIVTRENETTNIGAGQNVFPCF